MRAFLVLVHAAAYLHHVHVVVVSVSGVCLEVEVLVDDALHGFPVVVDVTGGSPGVGYVADPGAWVGPSAYVEGDFLSFLLGSLGDSLADLGVLETLVQTHVVTTAEVHLDKVVVPVDEVGVAVGFLISCQSHAASPRLFLSGATGVVACIGVDTCREAQLVDVVGYHAHAVREFLGVDAELSVAVASVPVSVVDVDVLVACLCQSGADHGIGLPADDILGDVQGKSVPGAPSQGRWVKVLCIYVQGKEAACQKGCCACCVFHRFMFFSYCLV